MWFSNAGIGRTPLDRVVSALRFATGLLGLLLVWNVVHVALRRVSYPFELEWMEGGLLVQVSHVLSGKSLYQQPSPEFMPFLYAPGYTYVGAIFAKILGTSLFSLRVVSIASTIAIFGILFCLVHAETRSVFAGTMAAGLFAGTFDLSGAWFDLARVDSLALALALGAVLSVRIARRPAAFVASGLFAAASAFTKQNMLVILPVIVLWSASRGWRAVAASVGSFAVAALAAVVYLQAQSRGWFWYYVVELPATHGMKGREELVTAFFREELFRALPVATTCALLFLGGFPLAVSGKARSFHGILAALLLAVSYASRLHMGSSLNDLMPAHAALALVFGLTLQGASPENSVGRKAAGQLFACALLGAVQFVLLFDDFDRYVPDGRDYAAGERIIEQIRSVPGDVLVVNHPYLALLAGKSVFAHQMALIDVFEANRDPRGVQDLLRREWTPLFEQHHFSEVILDNDWYVFIRELRDNYRQVARLPIDEHDLWPKTATHIRPELIFVPGPSP